MVKDRLALIPGVDGLVLGEDLFDELSEVIGKTKDDEQIKDTFKDPFFETLLA